MATTATTSKRSISEVENSISSPAKKILNAEFVIDMSPSETETGMRFTAEKNEQLEEAVQFLGENPQGKLRIGNCEPELVTKAVFACKELIKFRDRILGFDTETMLAKARKAYRDNEHHCSAQMIVKAYTAGMTPPPLEFLEWLSEALPDDGETYIWNTHETLPLYENLPLTKASAFPIVRCFYEEDKVFSPRMVFTVYELFKIKPNRDQFTWGTRKRWSPEQIEIARFLDMLD